MTAAISGESVGIEWHTAPLPLKPRIEISYPQLLCYEFTLNAFAIHGQILDVGITPQWGKAGRRAWFGGGWISLPPPHTHTQTVLFKTRPTDLKDALNTEFLSIVVISQRMSFALISISGYVPSPSPPLPPLGTGRVRKFLRG